MSIHQPYSKLLIQEEPLQVLPQLAVEIGLNEAIILQQLHYWLNPRRNIGTIHEGRRWIYNTYQQWQDNFPFWSLRTIQAIILRLEQKELIESTDRFNTDTRDRTKWYTINYGHTILCAEDANLAHSMGTQILHGGHADLAHSTTKQRLHAETTPETTPSVDLEDQPDHFDTFWRAYPRKAGKGAAKAALAKAIKKVSIDTLLSAIEKQKKSDQWSRDDGKFIPHPSTWLNQERWEDDLPANTCVNTHDPVGYSDDPEEARRQLNADLERLAKGEL